jgi:hypothetical protein
MNLFFPTKTEMIIADPRNPDRRQDKYSQGKNAESFDPKTTFCRPQMRVIVEENRDKYPSQLKSDDVIITPNFESEDNIYETLINEMKCLQDQEVQDSKYISWACGTHLLIKNPDESKTFQKIIKRICSYYDLDPTSISVRYNFYKDDVDWKALHFDSAAFNKERAEKQNITVGLSLGKTRELVFKHAKNDTLVYFPMKHGSLYSFGKAVNIQWMHGINAVPKNEQTQEGRISIIIWGFAKNVIPEAKEPSIIENNDRRDKNDKKDIYCRDFANGKCKYGEKCKFIHKIRN